MISLGDMREENLVLLELSQIEGKPYDKQKDIWGHNVEIFHLLA